MDLANTVWNDETYAQFKEYLLSLADEKYKNFHSGLVPGITSFYGVSNAKLKILLKDLSKNSDILSFYRILKKQNSYEEKMLLGMVLPRVFKDDIGAAEAEIDEFSLRIDNWAVCDCFASALKPTILKNMDVFFKKVNEYVKSDKTFVVRLGFVILNAAFVDGQYLDDIFSLCISNKNDEYYVKMAVSWLISTCYIKYPEKTHEFIVNDLKDDFVKKKSVSKICDSFRVTAEQKNKLRSDVK